MIACSVDEVEEERKKHADVRREIGIKEPLFQSLIKFGDTIQDQSFKEEVRSRLNYLCAQVLCSLENLEARSCL